MPEKKFRLVILLLSCFLQGCGSQDRANKASVVAPLAIEKEVLERALADVVARKDSCLTAKIGPLADGPNYWPSALSFDAVDGPPLPVQPARGVERKESDDERSSGDHWD
jgi:hypothetical protein